MQKIASNSLVTLCFILTFSIGLFVNGCGCTVQDAKSNSGGSSGGTDKKTISIDGSSTVYPVSQAVAEEFEKTSEVRVVVGTSGTGPGFSKFIAGEIAICDASRPIKPEEIDGCKEKGIEYLELKIAIDGLSVVVNPENDWCDCLTVAQLKALWEPNSKIHTWKDLDPSWPDHKIDLYGADTESGTFDYFTEVICGKSGSSRTDYNPSVNDNVLVQGVGGSKYALGYFGYAYYVKNKGKLKVLGIAAGDDASSCVAPTDESIEAGKYVPLSRPLYLYVNKAALQRQEVASFLTYYLNEGQILVGEVGYVRLSESLIAETRKNLQNAIDSGKSSE
ncbi:MAG TPA: PstS family phosphate ABC transporter substrate-binding protein [Planctomycetaceae bacterium]|nr:PstS family phosphate ABC transporter substrate-binding protein [Planctomycetaceae bacterium]